MVSTKEISFTSLRELSILPPDAIVDKPYTLSKSPLCRICQDAMVKLSSTRTPLVYQEHRHHHCIQQMGTFRDLLERKGCPLCQLTTKGLAELCPPYAGPMHDDEQISFMINITPVDKALIDNARQDGIVVYTSRGWAGTLQDVKDVYSPRQYQMPGKVVPPVRLEPCNCCNFPQRICQLSSS